MSAMVLIGDPKVIPATRDERRALSRANKRLSPQLNKVPDKDWLYSASRPERLIEVWRSRDFLAQVFQEENGILRVSVCRAEIDASNGRWRDGISWEELQQVKREIGRGHLDAVEVYPADIDVVNVANMRHIWVLPDPLPFAWRRG
jgi:hypothetical protein